MLSPIQMKNLTGSKNDMALLVRLMSDLLKVHGQFISKLEETQNLIGKKVGPKGDRGLPGPAGKDVDEDKVFKYCAAIVEDLVRRGLKGEKGKDGVNGNHAITPIKGIDYLTQDEIDELYISFSNRFKSENPDKDFDHEEVVNTFQKKGKKLSTKHIDGLDQTISALYSQLGRGYLHGGGDTVKAGSNITITRNPDGTTTIASTGGGGGSTIAMQSVTAVQSGNNVTIDLTQLAHTFTGVLMVTDQGQTLDTTRWSIIGNSMTVTNTFDSDSFQIQYTY